MSEYRTTPQKIEDNQLYRYYRNQWLLAGTDNFTAPPAQNQDMFERLINILPPATNTLNRRWGYRNFYPKLDLGGVTGDENVQAPPTTPVATIKARNLYSYENHALNERTVIGTAGDGTGANSLTNNVIYWDNLGNPISIYTPVIGAGNPRGVNARDYEYFVDGVAGDQRAWNIATGVTRWGIVAPTTGLSLASTSGTTASWVANTEFTTMGILVDANNNVEQLVGVNARKTNTSLTLGTSGVGQPNWNQTVGGTTADTAVTWTNAGPIGLWRPNSVYHSIGTATVANPGIIYDPITQSLYLYLPAAPSATSGAVRPAFKTGNGVATNDGASLSWGWLAFVQTATQTGYTAWKPSTAYTKAGYNILFPIDNSKSAVVEPMDVADAYVPISDSFSQTIILQVCSTAGTTPATETNPFFSTVKGTYSDDNQLRWLNLGSATWPAATPVVAWAPRATNFSAIKDSNGNIQICIASGTTAGSAPTWSTAYGATTNEITGTAVWTCVGTSLSWAASTQWYLPTNGFIAPQTTTSFGGASIVDSNTNLEVVINSGKSGGSQPTWNPVGSTTTDGTITWFNVQSVAVGTGVVTLATPIGRRYYVVYLNSAKQNFSDLSPISLGTGIITNGQISLFNIPVSPDPQVDSKVILATADGGNPNTLYFVGQILNAITTFSDNTPEAVLILGNIYAQLDVNGNIIGVIGNQPAPNGQFPVLHKGRVFMIVGTQLVFSKSLAEVSTSTGIIAGRFEEDFPLTYAIDLSPGAENGLGLLSDGYALYIGTEKHVRRLLGDGPLNFQQPNVIFSETGLMTQNVWKIVFLEGTPIGTMWVTPDFRVIGSDFNTYNDVGTAIQSTLNTINPAAVNNCWAESITYGPYNFYVLALATGSNTDPDTICVYDLHLRKWYVWQYTDKFISGIFYINIAGIPRWLAVDNSGFVRFMDQALVMDRQLSTETAVGIVNTIRTTWLELGDPSLRKTMNEIEVATSDKNMLVTIEGASTQSDFTTPNVVLSNLPLVSNIFGQLKVFVSGFPAIYRYYRFTLTSTSSLAASLSNDVILGYFSSEVLPLNRI